MPITPPGQSVGQALGDLFGGVNRPQLNAFVATSQAKNGLVSAQTQEAMIKAQQAQEEQDAYQRLPQTIQQAYPDVKPSEALLLRDLGLAHLDPVTYQKGIAQNLLASQNPQSQTTGQQMFEGKVAGPITAPGNYFLPAGSQFQGQTPSQNPEAAAQTANYQAEAQLHNAQATNPAAFHHANGAGGPMDPQAIDFGAYMLYKTGKMPSLGMGAGPARSAILARAAGLAQQEAQGQPVSNPGFDTAIANGQDYSGAQRALNSYAGGPLGNSVRSINNAVGHMQLFENLFSALQNGDMQSANKLKNAWNKEFGSSAPTDIQTAATFIGPELVKLLAGNSGAGTGPERQEFAQTAGNLANAPEQTLDAIHTLKGMLGRQATDLAVQYHGATGRSDFARRYVAPDVAQYLEIGPEGTAAPAAAPQPANAPLGSTVPVAPSAAAPPAAPAGPVKIVGDADYAKLPSGAHFIGPDGHERIKP